MRKSRTTSRRCLSPVGWRGGPIVKKKGIIISISSEEIRERGENRLIQHLPPRVKKKSFPCKTTKLCGFFPGQKVEKVRVRFLLYGVHRISPHRAHWNLDNNTLSDEHLFLFDCGRLKSWVKAATSCLSIVGVCYCQRWVNDMPTASLFIVSASSPSSNIRPEIFLFFFIILGDRFHRDYSHMHKLSLLSPRRERKWVSLGQLGKAESKLTRTNEVALQNRFKDGEPLAELVACLCFSIYFLGKGKGYTFSYIFY